ncbi:MAG: S8 family serine peptidase [Thermoleophilia bacterium]|nr:S8 family serine peptidase [Thermoleophilia bacterium]
MPRSSLRNAARHRVQIAAWFLVAGGSVPAFAQVPVAADPLVEGQAETNRVAGAHWGRPSAARIPPIAIIEAGIDHRHPEMQGGWVTVRRVTPTPDLADSDSVDRFLAGIAHGTAVASVIGAPHNGVGIEGVLPGARVWVYGGSGTCSDTARAVVQAVNDGAKVINASYGFSNGGQCLEHRIATSYAFGAGALVVAAAGNGRPSQPWIQPGNDWHVLTVGAVNRFNQPTSFTFQKTYTDLVAPGEGILTAVPTWADNGDEAVDGYSRLDGTSFSAPIVSAVAAATLARRPNLAPDQLAEVLRRSALDVHRDGWDRATGWGLIDPVAAQAEGAPSAESSEPNEDIPWVTGALGFRPDAPLLRWSRAMGLRARLDLTKDPRDVYPVWVPARTRLTVTLRPRLMGMDLFVWHPDAKIIGDGSPLARSRRSGLVVERVMVTNHGSRGRRVFVEVRALRSRSLSGDYRLGLRHRSTPRL